MTTTAQLKQEILANMETVRGLRRGLIVAEVAFAFEVTPETATAALQALVKDGVLVAAKAPSGRVNVYTAAPSVV